MSIVEVGIDDGEMNYVLGTLWSARELVFSPVSILIGCGELFTYISFRLNGSVSPISLSAYFRA